MARTIAKHNLWHYSWLQCFPMFSWTLGCLAFVVERDVINLRQATATVPAPSATGWISAGCYSDSVAARTLTTGAMYGLASNVTNDACNSACQTLGYSIAGTEYAGECYCDNTFHNTGAPVTDGCTMACNGNSSQICGGGNRLTVFTLAGHVIPPTPTTSAGTAAGSAVGGGATALPTGWSFKGCYIDNLNGRVLNMQQPDSQTNSAETCASVCSGLGYGIAGLEFGVQCFCDNYLYNSGALTVESDCNMACSGNANEKCGAGNRLSVYSNDTLKVFQPPATQQTDLPGNWKYAGCLWDLADKRSLQYLSILSKNNTASNCLKLCSDFGYGAAGMEYGEECWCGDAADVQNAGATFRTEADCNKPCTGNASTICGGGNALSYYTWNGTPLQTWDFPQGNAAGRYEFLIGGVIIPLITQPAINGKVTYLEKFGTGPPNSTGAYELDLAQLNNFTGAWREMHVKSDVFCAASLTLPDRAGRQLNIGGWANDDTYAIRLYAPDGSPGIPGKNDWQENSKILRMQAGRWYPSMLLMANGSVLVVGGEVGSNGKAVPNLEVIPKPEGGYVKFCDWLNRTDPYNLYPFLAVLPTGGIFVAYYNEARILDEITFDTIKILPNIPGAVNNFLGGRTYPFEGTMMIMPQRAPYTEPLTLLICGGSTPGPEIALDNCASIQPEAANPKWTIERMPSKRVITCMTALPDGTYMILNGGQHGRAGFSTSSEPNHNAVLYDPAKPVNARMSVMANTTVDRLYHSEAVLLQDGRILVSGSDPQDQLKRFPQEYRNEVFVPPYLTSGTPRPEFKVSAKDIPYGGTTVVTISNGVIANIQVSLMGAESSTHGNTFGQRTIFPAFSCAGNTCTITAPPNAHVCPAGWFQLFVLSNGIPSKSTWIRIGGDPAALGNWPDLPGFDKPGMGTALPSN